MKFIIDHLVLFFFKSFCWLARSLPAKLGQLLSLIFVRFCLLLLARSKAVALANLKACFPEKQASELNKIYQNSIKVLADNFYTFCLIPKLNREFIEKNVDLGNFAELYDRLKNKSATGSVIFATAHYGCFELMAFVSALVNGPTSILARTLGLEKTDDWWNSIRTMFGNEVYARKGGYKETTNRLKAGKNVALLCDQNVKANYAVYTELFGIPCASAITIAHAAASTSAPILFVVMARTSDNNYKILCKEVETPQDKSDLNSFTAEVMKNYHQILEDSIKQFPDHWFWIHRRFKTRPPGIKEDFYESINHR